MPEAIQKEWSQYPLHLQQLLYNRGFADSNAIHSFLNPDYDTELHDPYLLHDMAIAVERILRAIEKQERIVVFSDYDSDGIPGAVIMHDFFTKIGYDNFAIKIPHRHYDGFGLSKKAVDEICGDSIPDVLITIDCGTSDVEAVAYAKEKGIDVIVTDHHEAPQVLPEAVAIVNPKLGSTYPFTGLCGAGVAFKLVQAILQKNSFALPVGYEKWWLDMVAIATIADMVPLLDENRVLAHYGLLVLRKSPRPGMQKLLRKQRVFQKYLTEDEIGFVIAPRINAASRMDTPEDAFWLLATKDEADAGGYVAHLEKLNTKRKAEVSTITKELHKKVAVTTPLPPVLVYGNPEWRPSLVGLAANKLAEEHNRPVFLWGRDGNEVYKGSCRSEGATSVVKIMEAVDAGVLTEFGGHHMSGGFSVSEAAIYSLSDSLVQAYNKMGEDCIVPQEYTVDMEISLDDITDTFIKIQAQCAPFGCDNPKPLYLLRNQMPVRVECFGKGKEHTKLTFKTTGLATEAIAFFTTPTQFNVEPKADTSLHFLAHVEQSYFMNRLQTRLRIVDTLSSAECVDM